MQDIKTKDMTLDEIKAYARQALKPPIKVNRDTKPNKPIVNKDLLLNLKLSSPKEDIRPLANFIGRTEQRGITTIYTKHDTYIALNEASLLQQEEMTKRGLLRLEHQTYQVNIQGKRTQHTNYQEAIQYQRNHKKPRQSLAKANRQRELAERHMNSTSNDLDEAHRTIATLTIRLNKVEQQNRLLSLLTRPEQSTEQTLSQLLLQLKARGRLNRANRPNTEDLILAITTLKQALSIQPDYKEFADTIKEGLS